MKKKYTKPVVEIECYELSNNIASNCGIVVNMGPEAINAIKVCDEYYEITGEPRNSNARTFSMPHNIQFWAAETCDCYYTAGAGFFTS